MDTTIVKSIEKRIFGHGAGWVFTPGNFDDIGSNTGVRQALSRLHKAKIIRRVAQGIYDYPRKHKTLGVLAPSVDDVAKAYARKNGAKLQAGGAYAANLIGLSEQVPGRVVFLTDGPTGKVKIGKLEISFKKTSVKNMAAAGSREALVVQAFKHMQRSKITPIMLETAKRFLKGSSKNDFNKNLAFAPRWIRTLLFDPMERE